MSEMPDCNLNLFLNRCHERPLVVDLEGEYAMLVGKAEGCRESGAVRSVCDCGEGKALERREHGEFELEGIGRWELEGPPRVVRVFRKGDGVGLIQFSNDIE